MFKFIVVPAGQWRRIPPPAHVDESKLNQGAVNEDRPHLVPLNETAEKLVIIDATGFIGRTGLCPGLVSQETSGLGHETYAYRFQKLTEAEAKQMIADLTKQVDEICRK